MLERLRMIACLLALGVAPACKPAPADPGPPPSAPRPASSAPASADADDDAPPNRCNTDADCGDGVCEGEGCGPDEGVCAPRERICTRDLRTYCGCDGKTFQSSGSCPGARFSQRGEC